MDALAQLFDLVRVRSTIFFAKSLPDTWGIEVPHHEALCRFHLVLSGETWISIPETDRRERLTRYDFAIVPHGRTHTLSDTPDRVITDREEIPGSQLPQTCPIEFTSEATSLLCGYFRFSESVSKSLMSQLPDLLILRSGDFDDSKSESVEALVKVASSELSVDRLARELILNRCTEVLTLFALRGWVQSETPFGGALSDQRINRAISAMLERPQDSWTVESLSRLAGQSRTVFAELFRSALGVGPIEFLQGHRIQVARSLLTETDLRLAAVAARVGYRDISAFSRAFSRIVGVSPAQYRKVSRG